MVGGLVRPTDISCWFLFLTSFNVFFYRLCTFVLFFFINFFRIFPALRTLLKLSVSEILWIFERDSFLYAWSTVLVTSMVRRLVRCVRQRSRVNVCYMGMWLAFLYLCGTKILFIHACVLIHMYIFLNVLFTICIPWLAGCYVLYKLAMSMIHISVCLRFIWN